MGLGALVVGSRTRLLFPFISEEPDPHNPGEYRECANIMGFLHSALTAGQYILQLGCNRAQLMVAFKNYVASACPAIAMPSALPLLQLLAALRTWGHRAHGPQELVFAGLHRLLLVHRARCGRVRVLRTARRLYAMPSCLAHGAESV